MRALKLLLGQRHDRGAAAPDRAQQSTGPGQHMFGVEAGGDQLGFVKHLVLAGRQLGLRDPRRAGQLPAAANVAGIQSVASASARDPSRRWSRIVARSSPAT